MRREGTTMDRERERESEREREREREREGGESKQNFWNDSYIYNFQFAGLVSYKNIQKTKNVKNKNIFPDFAVKKFKTNFCLWNCVV